MPPNSYNFLWERKLNLFSDLNFYITHSQCVINSQLYFSKTKFSLKEKLFLR